MRAAGEAGESRVFSRFDFGLGGVWVHHASRLFPRAASDSEHHFTEETL